MGARDVAYLLCSASPRGALRTRETVERFKGVPAPAGQPSPLLVYFGTLLTRGKLNALESAELATLVLAQGKKHLLDAWLKDGKLEASEALGDALRGVGDADAALAVYREAGAQGRVIEALAAKGDFGELSQARGGGWGVGLVARAAAEGCRAARPAPPVHAPSSSAHPAPPRPLLQYASSSGSAPNYVALLQRLMMDNPDAAVALAKQVVRQPGPPVTVNAAADLFLQRNMVGRGWTGWGGVEGWGTG